MVSVKKRGKNRNEEVSDPSSWGWCYSTIIILIRHDDSPRKRRKIMLLVISISMREQNISRGAGNFRTEWKYMGMKRMIIVMISVKESLARDFEQFIPHGKERENEEKPVMEKKKSGRRGKRPTFSPFLFIILSFIQGKKKNPILIFCSFSYIFAFRSLPLISTLFPPFSKTIIIIIMRRSKKMMIIKYLEAEMTVYTEVSMLCVKGLGGEELSIHLLVWYHRESMAYCDATSSSPYPNSPMIQHSGGNFWYQFKFCLNRHDDHLTEDDHPPPPLYISPYIRGDWNEWFLRHEFSFSYSHSYTAVWRDFSFPFFHSSTSSSSSAPLFFSSILIFLHQKRIWGSRINNSTHQLCSSVLCVCFNHEF